MLSCWVSCFSLLGWVLLFWVSYCSCFNTISTQQKLDTQHCILTLDTKCCYDECRVFHCYAEYWYSECRVAPVPTQFMHDKNLTLGIPTHCISALDTNRCNYSECCVAPAPTKFILFSLFQMEVRIINCIAEFSSKVSSFRVMNIDYKTFALVALIYTHTFKIYFSLFTSPKYNGQFKIVNFAENLTELVSQLSSSTWHLKTSK